MSTKKSATSGMTGSTKTSSSTSSGSNKSSLAGAGVGGGLSQIPSNPSFRNAAVNAVAIVPLLSSPSDLHDHHHSYPISDASTNRTGTTTRNTIGTTAGNTTGTTTFSDRSALFPFESTTHSIQSFNELMSALRGHHYSSTCGPVTSHPQHDDFVLVVPNSSLTRPGDWRYDTTPLPSFHWQHGCQRLWVMDGRPPGSVGASSISRQSHDRLLNHSVSWNWIDLFPYRRTAAVVGVLSMNDCRSIEDFHRAEEELHQWALQYSTPPYAVTSRGQTYSRDIPIQRLFVYDSFNVHNDACAIDVNSATKTLGSNRIFAFPPRLSDVDHFTNVHLMNLHLNVVINDLAVAVFRDLENKIKDYQDALAGLPPSSVSAASATMSTTTNGSSTSEHSRPDPSGRTAGSSTMLNDDSFRTTTTSMSSSSAAAAAAAAAMIQQQQLQQWMPRLLTPFDDDQPEPSLASMMHPREVEAMRKRDIGRREKWCGDLSLLAGSPLDAYEHYLKATELLSSRISISSIHNNSINNSAGPGAGLGGGVGTNAGGSAAGGSSDVTVTTTANTSNSSSSASLLALDPLWYACALEGCAAAHIAMADGGGYNVDEYLESNFQLPDEIMSLLLAHQAATATELDHVEDKNSNNNTSSNAVGSNNTISKRTSTQKQTLPEVVFTLCEESLAILCRHPLSSHLYAELLMKLAKYCSEEAEGHLRCTWGYGDGCHSGIDATTAAMMMMSNNSDGGSNIHDNDYDETTVPRWLRTSTSKLLALSKTMNPTSAAGTTTTTTKHFQRLSKLMPLPAGMNDMATVNTVYRIKKVCELLHASVSIATLDPATRVDVAAQSTVLCLKGIKPTNWRGLPVDHIPLPRKAAYFSIVAAETLSSVIPNKQRKARDLWLLSTQLYSRTTNPLGGIGGNYGWATLRAYCLEALSMQGNNRIALEASIQLLSLLSELIPSSLSPSLFLDGNSNPNDTRATTSQQSMDFDETLAYSKTPKKKNTANKTEEISVSRHDLVVSPDHNHHLHHNHHHNNRATSVGISSNDGADRNNNNNILGLRNDFGLVLDEGEIQNAVANASQFARNLRDTYRMSVTNAASALLNQGGNISNSTNNKWSDSIGELQPALMPFGEIPSALTTLRAVWPISTYETCVYSQKHCLERMSALRRSLPTVSGSELEVCSIYGTDDKKLPLYVTSAIAIHVDSALEMECVKKIADRDKSKEGAMATFFNPYEAKKTVNTSTVRVAEEEERAMRIEFGNRLAIPLEVQRSQLVFANDTEGRVKAAALSFIIPAQASSFTVQFPFTVLSKPMSSSHTNLDSRGEDGDSRDANNVLFEVKGLDLTCFGRIFFVPIQELSDASHQQFPSGNLPESASLYPYRAVKKSTVLTPEMKPRVETFPCQPRLHVLSADTSAPVGVVSVGLSDGEIHTIPPFRLENYMGPTSKGRIERLEIYSVNIPGVSDKKLFDSDLSPVHEVDEATFVNALVWKDNSPPFVFRALARSLKLSVVNGSEASTAPEDSIVTIQIAAAHNLGERIQAGTTMSIRFRYRGLSNSASEVWRKREVILHVKHVKGPRISSITLRPDLARESALAEMSQHQALATPKPSKFLMRQSLKDVESENEKVKQRAALCRIGLDNEVNVCSDKAYFILTVANETSSVLSLERLDGPVGGFDWCPLDRVTVRPGVSAKIPVVIDRLRRFDPDSGCPADIVSELVARTNIVWKSHKGSESGPVKARGFIRIPHACLKDIVARHPSILSHICQPPCSLELFVGKPVHTPDSKFVIALGKPVSASLLVKLEPWIPKYSFDNCLITIEFRCGRKTTPFTITAGTNTPLSSPGNEYFWAGKVRQTMDMNKSGAIQHSVKIAFCVVGQYAVSACVKINTRGSTREEVWWAPVAQTVVVEESSYPVLW